MTEEPEIRSLLVLHAGALGDCVLTMHVIRAVGASCGRPQVTLAARSTIAVWAQRHGLIAESRTLEGIDAHLFYASTAELPPESLRFLRRFDCIVSFLGGPGDAVSARLREVHGGRVVTIDPRPKPSTLQNGIHITEQWVLELVDQGLSSIVPVGTETADGFDRRGCRSRLATRLGDQKARLALCHPGSGGLDKCCPIDILERLVSALTKDAWTTGWIIGPDEIERFGSDYVQRLERTAPVIFEESVEEAADLVCGADLYIGHDAGMTHVAAMAGIATIAIFGPTDPRVWRPLGPRCRVVDLPQPDSAPDRWISTILRLAADS